MTTAARSPGPPGAPARAFRRAGPGDLTLAWLWAMVVAAALPLAWVLRPAAAAVPCVFHTVTGLPCPTCGATRAAEALFAGRPLDALWMNPGVVLAGILFAAGGLAAPAWVRLRGPVPELGAPLPAWARLLAVGLVLANWTWVLVAGR